MVDTSTFQPRDSQPRNQWIEPKAEIDYSWLEGVAAATSLAFKEELGYSAARSLQLSNAGGPQITQSELDLLNKEYSTDFDYMNNMTRGQYDLLRDMYYKRLLEYKKIQSSGVGLASVLLGSFVGSAADPTNLLTVLVPAAALKPVISGVRAASSARIIGKHIKQGAKIGAMTNTIETIAREPFIVGMQSYLQTDYGVLDSAMNLGMSPVVGGALGGLTGAVSGSFSALRIRGDELRAKEESAQAAIRKATVDSMVFTELDPSIKSGANLMEFSQSPDAPLAVVVRNMTPRDSGEGAIGGFPRVEESWPAGEDVPFHPYSSYFSKRDYMGEVRKLYSTIEEYRAMGTDLLADIKDPVLRKQAQEFFDTFDPYTPSFNLHGARKDFPDALPSESWVKAAEILTRIYNDQRAKNLTPQQAANRLLQHKKTLKLFHDNSYAPSDPKQRAVGLIYKTLFGVNVRFYGSSFERMVGAEGAASFRAPDTIFVSSAHGSLPNILRIAGHELFHNIKYRNPELFGQLYAEIAKAEGGKVLSSALRHTLARQDRLHLKPLDVRIDEAMADVMGELMRSPKFFAKLRKDQPNLAKKIELFLYELLARVSRMSKKIKQMAFDSSVFSQADLKEVDKLYDTLLSLIDGLDPESGASPRVDTPEKIDTLLSDLRKKWISPKHPVRSDMVAILEKMDEVVEFYEGSIQSEGFAAEGGDGTVVERVFPKHQAKYIKQLVINKVLADHPEFRQTYAEQLFEFLHRAEKARYIYAKRSALYELIELTDFMLRAAKKVETSNAEFLEDSLRSLKERYSRLGEEQTQNNKAKEAIEEELLSPFVITYDQKTNAYRVMWSNNRERTYREFQVDESDLNIKGRDDESEDIMETADSYSWEKDIDADIAEMYADPEVAGELYEALTSGMTAAQEKRFAAKEYTPEQLARMYARMEREAEITSAEYELRQIDAEKRQRKFDLEQDLRRKKKPEEFTEDALDRLLYTEQLRLYSAIDKMGLDQDESPFVALIQNNIDRLRAQRSKLVAEGREKDTQKAKLSDDLLNIIDELKDLQKRRSKLSARVEKEWLSADTPPPWTREQMARPRVGTAEPESLSSENLKLYSDLQLIRDRIHELLEQKTFIESQIYPPKADEFSVVYSSAMLERMNPESESPDLRDAMDLSQRSVLQKSAGAGKWLYGIVAAGFRSQQAEVSAVKTRLENRFKGLVRTLQNNNDHIRRVESEFEEGELAEFYRWIGKVHKKYKVPLKNRYSSVEATDEIADAVSRANQSPIYSQIEKIADLADNRIRAHKARSLDNPEDDGVPEAILSDATLRINALVMNEGRRRRLSKRISQNGISWLKTLLDGRFRQGAGRTEAAVSMEARINSRRIEDREPVLEVLGRYGLTERFNDSSDPLSRMVFEYIEKPDPSAPEVIQEIADILMKLNDVQVESLRVLGVPVNKLDGYWLTTTHSKTLLSSVSLEHWRSDVLDMLDIAETAKAVRTGLRMGSRSDYDSLMALSDRDLVVDALNNLYEDVLNNRLREGLDSAEAMMESLTNPVTHSRKLIFKHGKQFDYDLKYGSGDPAKAVNEQIMRRSELIANVEVFGTNPRQMIRDVLAAERIAKGTLEYSYITSLVDHHIGKLDDPVNKKMASWFQTVRNIAHTAFLGRAVFMAMQDFASSVSTIQYATGMSAGRSIGRLTKAMGDSFLRRTTSPQEQMKWVASGAGFDAITNASAVRLTGDTFGNGWSKKMVSTMFNVNLVNLWTQVAEEALIDVLGRATARTIASGDADGGMAAVLARHGLTPEELGKWMQLDDRGVARVLADNIEDPNTARKLRTAFDELLKSGVLRPDAGDLTVFRMGLQAGTFAGEGVRTLTMYLPISTAIYSRVIQRMMHGYGEHGFRQMWSDPSGKAAVNFLTFIGLSAAIGYIGMVLKDISVLKEPWYIANTDEMYLRRWLFQTGLAGPMSDFLFAFDGDSFAHSLSGPVFGTAADIAGSAMNADGRGLLRSTTQALPFASLPPAMVLRRELLAATVADGINESGSVVLNSLDQPQTRR